MTNSDDDLDRLRAALLALTPAQSAAVSALVAGRTHAEAAEAALVTRETVCRWVNHAPAVVEALGYYRSTVAAELVDAARRTRAKALAVVDRALDDDNVAVAVAVLKAVPTTELARPVTAAECLADEARRRAAARPRQPAKRDASGRISGMIGPDALLYDTTTEAAEAAEAAGLALLAEAVAPTFVNTTPAEAEKQ
jgi:hypothetical protein